MSNSEFWYGKRVLITGGDGFVASNMTRTLIERGANVVVVTRHQRPFPTWKLLGDDVHPDIEQSDLTDFINVQKICNRHQIDTIFHLAASAIVSDASHAPISTFENNITPTLNLVETARINAIPRVLIASSDKSYGDHAHAEDPERIPYLENYSLRGLDVYSASKVCADMIAQTYAYQFNLGIMVARPCNIFGPGDLNFTRLIPRTILRLLVDARPVINEGNAHVDREYIYIDDVVEAYLFLAEHMDQHMQAKMPRTGPNTYGWASYNVGCHAVTGKFRREDNANIKNVTEVIDLIRERLGKTDIQPVVLPKHAEFIEIPDQYLDSSRIMNMGFKAETSFEDGLDRAIVWYGEHREYLIKLGYKYLGD